MEYVKLSSQVGETITIKELKPFVWKSWDKENNKPLSSDRWVEGYKKTYPCVTNRGIIDLSSAQVASILEACVWGGKADLNDKTFEVKSNGKTGMEIRYFFNVAKTGASGYEQAKAKAEELKPKVEVDEVFELEEEISLGDIPF